LFEKEVREEGILEANRYDHGKENRKEMDPWLLTNSATLQCKANIRPVTYFEIEVRLRSR
jgi:hypothetical protein